MKKHISIGCLNKFDVEVFYDSSSERYLSEVLEREEYRFLLTYLKKKEDLTVIDVGCNIGTFSLYVYDIAKVIYSMEPVKEVLYDLEKTARQNNLIKIKTFIEAMGGYTGKGRLNIVEPVSSGASFLHNEGKKEVDVITAYDFLEREGIDKVDILKIDTEGEELNIIQEFNFPAHKIDLIIGEYHTGKMNKDDFLAVLEDRGYKPKVIDSHHFIATL